MNEQANKILADLLQKASNGIDAAVSFSQAQIPDVIHQLLMWNFAESIIFSLTGVLLFLLAQYLTFRIFKYLRKEWEGDYFSDHPESIFLFMAWLLINFIPINLLDLSWLKIWIAPKLYLIEYAAHLVK
ncbi:hypothetical protein [uncultured Erwinia sp.]|uniref:hypothetical protein n=1 Tax=uncultured Erwinia sp. TaxID=246798 RepID=UPI00258F5F48|nr:hypothetical protein [uncultured Erwinia sp.]